MVELVAELSKVRTEADAREALRAFIAVRRKYVPRYAARAGEVAITRSSLRPRSTRSCWKTRKAASARRLCDTEN